MISSPTQQPSTTQTHMDTIMAHLMAGKTISTWQAYQLYHITCLAQRISDLGKLGIPIQREMTAHNGKRFMVYWLDTDTIEQLKADPANLPINSRHLAVEEVNHEPV